MASLSKRVVVLATGGTIAGSSGNPGDNVRYCAGQVGVEALVEAVPALRSVPLEARQLAQIDSKDVGHALWWSLSRQVADQLSRAEVSGVVITHGTDTLEETAYWLWRTVVASKPVVLTAAMRPASSLQADGPQNLLDAVTLARHEGARGVLAVLGGQVLAGHELRKVHNYWLDAFSPGDAGPTAWLEEGRLRQLRAWPAAAQTVLPMGLSEPPWPWVEIVTSHAGADGRLVDLLADQGVQGLVVAGTGNGTVHADLTAALRRAEHRGIRVLRSTRCVLGHLVDDGGEFEGAGGLTPAQARVELMLRLLGS
jgi:L-asparaginase